MVHTFKGNDGKMYSYVNKNVESFGLKTKDDDYNGASKGVDIGVKGEGGSWYSGMSIWDSPEKKAADQKFLRDQHQRSIDVANSTPDHPHPDTWKLDKNMNVTEAGNHFKAEYDPNTGELLSARLGDHEWNLGPDNTVLHSYKTNDGGTEIRLLTDVRSFRAKPYSDNTNGLLAGMTVEVGTGESSSSSISRRIYENEEHAKWSNQDVNGWVKNKGN